MNVVRVVTLGTIALALLVAGCATSDSRATPTSPPARPASVAPASTEAAGCRIPLLSWADLETCEGESEEISLDIPDSYEGKTTARIAVDTRDPEQILAAMGAYTKVWSLGAGSFTLFAYGAESDPAGGYDRGRIFWNDDGTVTVDVCTMIEVIEASDGSFELCTEQATFTLPRR